MRAITIIFLAAALAVPACQKSGSLERVRSNIGEDDPLPDGEPPADPAQRLPGLNDPVVYQNEWCTYQDTVPYVRDVNWEHRDIQAAMAALGPGWRSTFVYGEWKLPYGLESQSKGDDSARAQAIARNFVRVLCGENRDNPEMIRRKLEVVIASQVYAGPQEMTAIPTEPLCDGDDCEPANLFRGITFPAYKRMLAVMRAVHSHRQGLIRDSNDGFQYGFGEQGHGSHRVEHSVPPWTHCEMKYMFERFMTAGSPVTDSGWGASCDETCVQGYIEGFETYRKSPEEGGNCTAEDHAYMYNFRGHKVYQPLWLDSNAFLWNSRRAGLVSNRNRRQNGDPSYYLHPFASRYERSRQTWGAWLLYPEQHHQALVAASESGGGPVMYMLDRDTDANGLADYILFPQDGCGDTGPSGDDPNSNCNMAQWDEAKSAVTTATTGAVTGWNADWVREPDMGFMRMFGAEGNFTTRMARFTQALDRHTNWGPTGYYMVDAPVGLIEHGEVTETRPNYIGSYSPIVACSYDISASENFAHGSYSTTMPFEQGHTKWMFIMRFRTEDYYDEEDMRTGRPMNFDRNYFNETSLSNDFYSERALDRFGWVPARDIHANIYFVYGSRGEEPPARQPVPPPADWTSQ